MGAVECVYKPSWRTVHCNPNEAYMRLITITCEAGPGATPMWILDICIWSLLILQFVDRCYLQNSTFDLSKWHLYIKDVMFFKVILPRIEPSSCKNLSRCQRFKTVSRKDWIYDLQSSKQVSSPIHYGYFIIIDQFYLYYKK
jgi:hypothetical protein